MAETIANESVNSKSEFTALLRAIAQAGPIIRASSDNSMPMQNEIRACREDESLIPIVRSIVELHTIIDSAAYAIEGTVNSKRFKQASRNNSDIMFLLSFFDSFDRLFHNGLTEPEKEISQLSAAVPELFRASAELAFRTGKKQLPELDGDAFTDDCKNAVGTLLKLISSKKPVLLHTRETESPYIAASYRRFSEARKEIISLFNSTDSYDLSSVQDRASLIEGKCPEFPILKDLINAEYDKRLIFEKYSANPHLLSTFSLRKKL